MRNLQEEKEHLTILHKILIQNLLEKNKKSENSKKMIKNHRLIKILILKMFMINIKYYLVKLNKKN